LHIGFKLLLRRAYSTRSAKPRSRSHI